MRNVIVHNASIVVFVYRGEKSKIIAFVKLQDSAFIDSINGNVTYRHWQLFKRYLPLDVIHRT